MNLISINPAKRTARNVLLVITVFLMLFPFINTMNQFLVKIIEPLIFLKPIQNLIIPYEVTIVRGILNLIGIPMTVSDRSAFSITLITSRGEEPVVVAWNCLGWQSLLIILATFLTGLTGKFTFLSKLEVLVVGLTGTFLLNMGRLVGIFVLFYYGNKAVAMAFHDYGSVVLTLLWLFGLWYYAFHFVLQSKSA